MIKKGIILAGGTGSRISPLTKAINKHLLPIYDKPMIYYPIAILMLAGIKNIQIIVNKGQIDQFKKTIGPTNDLGIKISYMEQSKPNGIPEAFIISKNFIKKESCVLILGDNFFYGQALSDYLENITSYKSGATIVTYPVNNVSGFGIAEVNKNGKIVSLVEKPKQSKSNRAITGLYVFDEFVSNYATQLKKSKRNEFEIVDLLNIYKKKNKLNLVELGRGCTWLDTGTFEDLIDSSLFVNIIEKKQKYKIACLEEIALKKKWISSKQIINRIKFYNNLNYSNYLKKIIKNG